MPAPSLLNQLQQLIDGLERSAANLSKAVAIEAEQFAGRDPEQIIIGDPDWVTIRLFTQMTQNLLADTQARLGSAIEALGQGAEGIESFLSANGWWPPTQTTTTAVGGGTTAAAMQFGNTLKVARGAGTAAQATGQVAAGTGTATGEVAAGAVGTTGEVAAGAAGQGAVTAGGVGEGAALGSGVASSGTAAAAGSAGAVTEGGIVVGGTATAEGVAAGAAGGSWLGPIGIAAGIAIALGLGWWWHNSHSDTPKTTTQAVSQAPSNSPAPSETGDAAAAAPQPQPAPAPAPPPETRTTPSSLDINGTYSLKDINQHGSQCPSQSKGFSVSVSDASATSFRAVFPAATEDGVLNSSDYSFSIPGLSSTGQFRAANGGVVMTIDLPFGSGVDCVYTYQGPKA